MRNQLDKYAAPEKVDWHFAHIENRWTKRALAAAGFGFKSPRSADPDEAPGHWNTIFSIAELGGSDSAARAAAIEEREELKAAHKYDIEQAGSDDITPSDKDVPKNPGSHRLVAVQGLNRPYFHFDLQEAVEAAVENAERKAY